MAQPYLRAPAVDEYARQDPAGITILPNGRFLQPAGRLVAVGRFPNGLAMSRDGKVLFVAAKDMGYLITGWQSGTPQVEEVHPSFTSTPDKKKAQLNGGAAAFSPDGKLLYWSSGEPGSVLVFDTGSRELLAEIPVNVETGGRKFEDSYISGLAISADGGYLYCTDVTNFRLAVIDTAKRSVAGSVQVGRYPYAVSVSGNNAVVANIGLFEYSPIGAPDDPKKWDPRGISRPAFGYPSRQARDGVKFEGRWIPGLGEANVPESFSVFRVDVSNPTAPQVTARWKTGLLIDAPSDNGKTVGGSAPNFVLLNGRDVFVSNSNNDIIERLDLDTGKVQAEKRIVPSPLVARFRGVGPAGMVLSPDGSRLYVAESGINSIAVMDAATLNVIGRIPTAWYPYRLAMAPDGRRLACINFKGFGNGPSGGSEKPASDFLGLRGAVTVVDTPADGELPALSRRVLENNGIVDRSADRKKMSSPVIPTIPGEVSKEIRYVVFITKENHTYDTIFDRVPGARHDPSLLRWGLHQNIKADGQPTLEDVAVMTNHNALARQFTISDNFYVEIEFSGVGHRWLVGVQPDNLMQMTYTLGWRFKKDSTAPGRRYSMGSAGSLIPEDYPEAGSMWEHLARRGISFRNYGEAFELPGVILGENERPTGAREQVNIPMSKVVYDNTAWNFPVFNMNIPDQYRAHWFMSDVEKRFLRGRKKLPQFVNITLCNDHGAKPRPEKGYPYVASWMADNDLALGRIVEFLSRTPYWKNMVIFVTEDDSGGEPDHVDAQRSVLLVISPWVKRGYVSHRHTTILSMHRTLYQIFGMQPLNMFDALANDFSDCFTTKPDFRPYTAVAVDKRIFDPEKAKDPDDPDYGQARRMPTIVMDGADEMSEVLREGAKEVTTAR